MYINFVKLINRINFTFQPGDRTKMKYKKLRNLSREEVHQATSDFIRNGLGVRNGSIYGSYDLYQAVEEEWKKARESFSNPNYLR